MQAIFFDFDGVIIDSVNIKTKGFEKLFAGFGEDIQSKVKAYHLEHGGISRFEKIKYFYHSFLDKQITSEEIESIANQFSQIVLTEIIDLPLVEGALDFFQKNSEIVDLYIISGTPEEELKIIADKKNISVFFKGIFGSPKTKTDIIQKIMFDKNYHREQVLFIGDAMTDYNAAINCGIPFLGVSNQDVIFPDKTNLCDNPFTFLERDKKHDCTNT